MIEKMSASETSRQMSAAFVLGTVLGLTPLLNLHNLFVLAVLLVVRLPYRSFLLGWAVAIPIGFLLDPVFDSIGLAFLTAEPLRGLWVFAANLPVVPLTSFNNTITLGSVVLWLVVAAPLFVLMKRVFSLYGVVVESAISKLPVVGQFGESSLVRRLLGIESGAGWVRKGFLIPLVLVLVVVGGSWWLFADRAARVAVERGGTLVVGATVDVETADLDLSDGTIGVTGLQVTDPAAPENNMVEVGSFTASMSTAALLSSRIAIDSVIIEDVRFNTPRETPGEVDTLRERSSFFRDQIAAWKASAVVPSTPSPDVSGLVDVSSLDPESFETVVRARAIAANVTSVRGQFETRIGSANPAAEIDSARAVLAALEGENIRSVGVAGAARTANSLRSTIGAVESSLAEVNSIRGDFTGEIGALRDAVAALETLKVEDYRRALGSLNIPSINPDDLSASVLQAPLMKRVETMLYWINQIEAFLPNRREPTRLLGPLRARGAGSDIIFPAGEDEPFFSMEKLKGSVAFAGMAGFSAAAFDVSTNPRLTGRPAILQLTGSNGESEATAEVEVDRTSDVVHDQFRARLVALPLPSFDLAALGGRLDLGSGSTNVALERTGDSISGVIVWNTETAAWHRGDTQGAGAGSTLLWETISDLSSVEISLGLGGTVTSPSMTVRSNIGAQAAGALRAQIGNQIRQAEGRVRAEVDRLSASAITEARGSVSEMESGIGARLAGYEAELDVLKTQLENRLRQFVPRLPGIGG